MWRITGKVTVTHARDDIVISVGYLQVFAGYEDGSDSLTHAMHTVYEKQSPEAESLVEGIKCIQFNW